MTAVLIFIIAANVIVSFKGFDDIYFSENTNSTSEAFVLANNFVC